jgi:hypothetical protein
VTSLNALVRPLKKWPVNPRKFPFIRVLGKISRRTDTAPECIFPLSLPTLNFYLEANAYGQIDVSRPRHGCHWPPLHFDQI